MDEKHAVDGRAKDDLTSAFWLALQANQKALDSLSRLYNHVSRQDESWIDFGSLVNRQAFLLSTDTVGAKFLSEVEGITFRSEEANFLPLWKILIPALQKICDLLAGPRSLVWAAASVNPPSGRVDKPLGFEDVVVLHSNCSETRSGFDVLDHAAKSEGFLSLAQTFFKVTEERNSKSQSSSDLEANGVHGIWLNPSSETKPTVVKDSRILKIPFHDEAIPEPLSGDGIYEVVYTRWREHYEKDGSLGNYTKPFRALSGTDHNTHLLFCPVMFTSSEGQVTAGANLSIGIDSQELSERTVKDLFLTLTALLAGIAPTTVAFSRSLAELRQHRKAHQRFDLLQRPLDALTTAFQTVQVEAQEMQSILNSPEESLFLAHKNVADIFVDRASLKISATVAVKPAHTPEQLDATDLRMIYVLILCSIFGKRDELLTAQTSQAVCALGREILRHTERSPMFDDVCDILGIITAAKANKVGIWETIEGLPRESANNTKVRQVKVVLRLKEILFTPFKDFTNSSWPQAPFHVAIQGRSVELDKLEGSFYMRHEFTPFPQHAILDFLLAAKGEYQNRRKSEGNKDSSSIPKKSGETFTFREVVMESGDSRAQPSRMIVKYSGGESFFYQDKQADINPFLNYVTKHGVAGRNYGNFLGCFARLLRNADGLVSEKDSSRSLPSDWIIKKPLRPNEVMRVSRHDGKRHFVMVDNFNKLEGELALIWMDADDERMSGDNATSAPKPSEVNHDSQPVRTARVLAMPTSMINCVLVDHHHDEPWAKVLPEVISEQENKMSIINRVVGRDVPKEVGLPSGTNVLILHTQQVEPWIESLGPGIGIVRISTSPGVTVPDGNPKVLGLGMIFPEFFNDGHERRKQAELTLLKAVMDVHAAASQATRP